MTDKYKLPVEMLRLQVDAGSLGFADTSELPPLTDPIGQERAVEALDFGLNMKSAGFNIYVSGQIGTGKWGIVRQMVRRLAKTAPAPPDLCYVNNFRDPFRPRYLAFPAAHGRTFTQTMTVLIEGLRRDIPTAFESTKYLDARAKIVEDTQSEKKRLFQEVTESGAAQGFAFQEEPTGFSLVPLREGHPMTDDEAAVLSESEQNLIAERRKALESKLREFRSRIHALDHEAEHRLTNMDQQVVKSVMLARFAVIREQYKDLPDVLDYLTQVEDHIVANYKDFIHRDVPTVSLPGFDMMARQPDLSRYRVNLIVEHTAQNGAPVVEESHPTYPNLIGKIERKAHLGVVFTDFTEIKAGSILQANGGYLILNALDLLRQPFAWDALKRVVKTRQVTIEDTAEFVGISTTGLRPQPIPVDLKVILLGPPMIYHLLRAYDEEFQKAFKVKADFDVDIPRNRQHDHLYARHVAKLCRDEDLPHFGADAVAEIVREGMRMAERRDRLSLRLSLLSDVIREAAFWSRRRGRALVSRDDVIAAIEKKRRRSSLVEQWVQDDLKEGTLLVDVDGEAVGQVNGLSVHWLGDYAFGQPCRITARTSVGTKGIIDIQREAELSGHIHSKGVLTLAGFLAGKFAGSHPFALNATLTFEQTYSEVEGDSAAAAELIAILSSLAEVPVRQSLAVTGSVNQLGEIQPIGGVNDKIEGFFSTCEKRGLTGRQGVIIPARNIKHLVLQRAVVDAVESGQFAVYGVNRIEEALELLTGLSAGERDEQGRFPEGTLYERIARRLADMAQIVASWGSREEVRSEK